MSVPKLFGSNPGSQIFNGYIAAQALVALWELGVLDSLRRGGKIDIISTAKEGNLSRPVLQAVCETLAAIGILEQAENLSFQLTAQGSELANDIGYFVWMVGGYGDLMPRLSTIMQGSLVYGRDIRRNDSYVAKGSELAGENNVLPLVKEAIRGRLLETVVDLGCGNAGFLISLCQSHPNLKAVGVDMSLEACNLAQSRVKEMGLTDRMEIICSSVEDAITFHRLPDQVDLITSFFMMHDLMQNMDSCFRILRGLKRHLSSTGRLLIVDTMKAYVDSNEPAPIFYWGFNLVHSIMGISTWSEADYENLFALANLDIELASGIGVPYSRFYLLR